VTFPAVGDISTRDEAEGWAVVAEWAADAEVEQAGFGDLLFSAGIGAVAAAFVSTLVALFRTGSPDFLPVVAAVLIAFALILVTAIIGSLVRGDRIKFGYDIMALRSRAAAYRLRAMECVDGDGVAFERDVEELRPSTPGQRARKILGRSLPIFRRASRRIWT
jgi:hypothetical protein